jgi:hypothetical protein
LYLILPSLLHEYALSESRTPVILDNMFTYRPFRGLEFLGLCASSLALVIAIKVGALFFFPFIPSSCLAVFSTDSSIQGIHQNGTFDSLLCVADLSGASHGPDHRRLRPPPAFATGTIRSTTNAKNINYSIMNHLISHKYLSVELCCHFFAPPRRLTVGPCGHVSYARS